MDLKQNQKPTFRSEKEKKELLLLSLSETVQMLSNIPGINNFNDTSKIRARQAAHNQKRAREAAGRKRDWRFYTSLPEAC